MTEQQIANASGAQLTTMAAQVSQILLRQGEQSTQLAVINTKLDNVVSAKDDHENRIRDMEKKQNEQSGARDMWARVFAVVAALAAAGAVTADWIHH